MIATVSHRSNKLQVLKNLKDKHLFKWLIPFVYIKNIFESKVLYLKNMAKVKVWLDRLINKSYQPKR